MKKQKSIFLLLILMLLSSCSSQPTQAPGFIYTVVASTQTASAYRTEMAGLSFPSTSTPILVTLRPSFTPYPTSTSFVFESITLTPTITETPTPQPLRDWPNWKTGEVVKMPSGSGANIGTNKKFAGLEGIMVMVVRKNGVALRPVPNKAIGGPMEEKGSAFTLTGVMNKNNDFVWFFAQVIASNGRNYWVFGSEWDEKTDPRSVLVFYYPRVVHSPTPTLTPTPFLFFTPTP